MSDDLIFREVDEELRQEQLVKVWKRYGNYIIAVAVLIVLCVAGYRGWIWYQADRAATSGARFEEGLRLADQGKQEEALAVFAGLARDGSGDYPLLSRFVTAGTLASAGDTEKAVAEYDAIAKDTSDAVLKDMARIQAARLLVDTASFETLAARLTGIDQPGNTWNNAAVEILGLAAYRASDWKTASDHFGRILTDPDAPAQMRERAELMMALITPKIAVGDAKPKDGAAGGGAQ